MKDFEKEVYKKVEKSLTEKPTSRNRVATSAVASYEVFRWAEEYFGISHKGEEKAPAPVSQKSSLDVDLFDLI